MSADIYDQHTAAFAKVSAFVVLDKDGARVATVAIKFPRDGAGRLYAYVHLIGVEMVRGFANGYGYDKRSAAVSSAIDRLPRYTDGNADGSESNYSQKLNAHREAFRAAAKAMSGNDWTRALESAGYRVLQAV